MYKFITEKKLLNRSLFLILSLFFSFCFYLWWTPALYLIPFLLLAPYGLSVFIWPCNKIEKCIKYGILGISILCLIIISFNLGRFLPSPMNSFFQKASIMLNFVAKKTTSSLPNISESISELKPPSLHLICDQIFGNVFNFLIFLFGLCILTYKFWRYLVFLVVPIGLCLLTIFGKRFLIYVVPFYALCIGVLFTFVYNWISKRKSHQILINILLGCLVIVTIFFNAKKSLSITLFPIINSYDVKLATTVKNKDGVIWTWWDYGYFLQYYTGCPTIIDGGSQDPLRTYITAFPLATSNPVLAKNWMRFFAAHSVYGFYKINNYFHSYPNTIEFLKNIFATQNLDNIIKKYSFLQKHPELKKYIFPDVKVYLYLPVRLYLLSYWWYYFGTWDFYIKKGIHPKTYLLKPGSFYIDKVNGMLRTRSQNIPIKDLYFYKSRNGRYFIQKISFNHQAIFDIFLNLDGKHIFLFDEDFSNCLFMRLTLLKPNTSGFHLLSYIPFYGSMWKN